MLVITTIIHFLNTKNKQNRNRQKKSHRKTLWKKIININRGKNGF
jgi:hypothetical protein